MNGMVLCYGVLELPRPALISRSCQRTRCDFGRTIGYRYSVVELAWQRLSVEWKTLQENENKNQKQQKTRYI